MTAKKPRSGNPTTYMLLGLVISIAGVFILPSYHGWRFTVGYLMALFGTLLYGIGRGRRVEIRRINKIMQPLQEALLRFDSARRYAAARERGPQ